MQQLNDPIIEHLKNAAYDYMPLAQSAAEADMLRYLSLRLLEERTHEVPRLNNHHIWDFYNAIYDNDYDASHTKLNQIADQFTNLKFENELSLTSDEKLLAPYHPQLNNLPPLIHPYEEIDFKNLSCFKMTQAQPYLAQKYQKFTTGQHLKSQINHLNQIPDRNHRLNSFLSVQRIDNHVHFPELNGQRGVFANQDIAAGTVIDFYSGEYRYKSDLMPPILCTWRIQKSQNWLQHLWQSRDITHYNSWIDAFILGNMMKLVNSCYYNYQLHDDIGNVGCYYAHLKGPNIYLTLPVYVAIKDIPQGTELLTFYHVGEYRAQNIYGVL